MGKILTDSPLWDKKIMREFIEEETRKIKKRMKRSKNVKLRGLKLKKDKELVDKIINSDQKTLNLLSQLWVRIKSD